MGLTVIVIILMKHLAMHSALGAAPATRQDKYTTVLSNTESGFLVLHILLIIFYHVVMHEALSTCSVQDQSPNVYYIHLYNCYNNTTGAKRKTQGTMKYDHDKQ